MKVNRNTVPKNSLQGLVENFIYEELDEDKYELISIFSPELLTWNRFDLGFKLFYLDLTNKNPSLANRVYQEDIRSQTLGKFKEPGNNKKNSFQKYIKKFEDIDFRIKKYGFDAQKSIIPLSETDTIINGAHRVASAIHSQKELRCVRLNQKVMICDYKYFYERSVPEHILDIAACKFIEYAYNLYMAFLWPSGKGFNDEVESKFSNIVYKKEIKLTPQGAFNLLVELYKHMDWVGPPENRYPGIQKKILECFPDFSPFKVIVFQEKNIDKVKAIKDEVRSIYNIGFSSVHITDTKEEVVRISNLLCNANGIHFLNYSDPIKYQFFYQNLENFGEFLSRHEIDRNDVLIDGSAILTLYGLRKNLDIDFLISGNSSISMPSSNFENHDSELKYHQTSKEDLIYDGKYFFQFKGFKFLSFTQLYKMKKRRGERKDRNDCGMMEALLEGNAYKQHIAKIKQYFFYSRIKAAKMTNTFILNCLKFTRLYSPVRHVYLKIKNQR